MRQRILAFVAALRSHGIAASPAEVVDAFHAVTVLGVERPVLRESLAACLVKSASDRPIFDRLFAKFFPTPAKPKLGPHSPSPREIASGSSKRASPEGIVAPRQTRQPKKLDRPLRQLLHSHEQRGPAHPKEAPRHSSDLVHDGFGRDAPPMLGPQRLADCLWRELHTADLDELREVLDKLRKAFKRRLARRVRRRRRGSLNFRATFRRAVTTGGTFVYPVFHKRKPKYLDLVVLCDLSYSVAQASQFFLSCLAATEPLFRRTAYYGFIDRAVELEVCEGEIRPVQALDFHARSDFGAVLTTMESSLQRHVHRNTLLLVLGDGRNNFRPPATHVLATLADRARAAAWIQPERPERWGTGDSAFPLYAKHCDIVVRASSPAELVRELPRALSRWI